jgi:hypothetical protein
MRIQITASDEYWVLLSESLYEKGLLKGLIKPPLKIAAPPFFCELQAIYSIARHAPWEKPSNMMFSVGIPFA